MLAAFYVVNGLVVTWLLMLAYNGSSALLSRRLGVVVTVVSIGIGPKLWVWRRGDEEWQFKLFPIGGFTQYLTTGDEDEMDYDAPLPAGSFLAAPLLGRLLVILVGPATSLLCGILLLGGAVWSGAKQVEAKPAGVDPPILGHKEQVSSWEGQLVLAVDTTGVYITRLLTFRSLEGWGGIVSGWITASNIGADSPIDWLTLMGVFAVSIGSVNLLPIPVFNGFQFLQNLIINPFVSRQTSEKICTPMILAGIVLYLILGGRVIWLDVWWIWHRWFG